MSKEKEFRKSMVPLMDSNNVIILDNKSNIYGRRNENGDLVATYWDDLTPEQQKYVVKNTSHASQKEIKVPKKGAAPTQEELEAFWECR